MARQLLTCVILCLAVAGPAAAQQARGGRHLTFGLDQKLQTARNAELAPGGAEVDAFAATTLSAALTSVTRTQSLALSADATLRAGRQSGGAEGGVALRYGLRGAGAELTASLRHRQQQVAFLEPLDLVDLEEGGLGVPEDLTDLQGRGWRRDSRFSLTGRFRQDRRLGLGVSLAGTRLTYRDVTAPDLVDSKSLSAALTARLTLRADTALSLRHGIAAREQEGGSRLHTRSLGARLTRRQPTASQSLSMEAVWPDAAEARLSLTGGLSRELGDGQRASLTLGGTMAEGGEARLVLGLDYLRRLTAVDRLALAADRRVRDESDGDVVLVTAARGRYARDLTPRTSLGLGGTYVATERRAGETRDYGLTLSLERALAEDWVLAAGLRRSLRAEDQVGDAVSDVVFVTIGRDWTLKF